jgi:hypothetical protein
MKNEEKHTKRLGPKWKPPTAVEIGDELVYYSTAAHFTFKVETIQHNGAWVFGRDVRDNSATRLGPVAVPLTSCMTPTQATTVLQGVVLPSAVMCVTDDTDVVM